MLTDLHRKAWCLTAGAVLGASMTFSVPALGAALDWFRVKESRPNMVVWVREGPSASEPKIGFLKHDARHIRGLGCKDMGAEEWCKILYRGVEGWVDKRFLARDTGFRT